MLRHKSNYVDFFVNTWQLGRLSTVSLLLSSLFLAACGGGSDDYSSTDNAADGAPSLSTVSIASGDKSTVTVGDVVTVTISSSEAISAPTVTIGGNAATTVSGADDAWTASRTMTADDTAGAIAVAVDYADIGGTAGVSAAATTDSSMITFEIILQAGFAIDGPFQNAKAFGDYNGNGLHDTDEPFDLTDENGAYSLVDTAFAPAVYTIVVEMTADTVDAISGESYADTGVVLKGSSAGTVVTPLTTILEAANVSNPEFTAADLGLAMGLPVGVDIATYNPFAADADAATAHAVETVFQQVMTATLLVAEAIQGVGAIAGVELSSPQASAAALTALTNMVVASVGEVDLADSAQVATLQTFAKTELAAQNIVVSDAVADFILEKASATVTTVAAAFDSLTADDFTAGNTAAVSIVKQEAAAELTAMTAAAVTYLADNTDVADLSAFDTSATLTLDTTAGVDAAVVDNGGDSVAGTNVVFDNGVVAEVWGGTSTLHFFDEANGYGDCVDEVAGTENCGSVDWAVVADTDRGDVLQVSYAADSQHAGLVLSKLAAGSVDLSAFATGTLSFDIKVSAIGGTTGFQLKVESGGSNSGEIAVADITGSGEWETINFPVATLIAGGLDVAAVNVPMVFFPDYQTGTSLIYQLDNVRFVAGTDGGVDPEPSTDITLTVAAPAGTTSVQLTGPWWDWGTGGPVAADNGDGTWTVTMAPGGENMEYLWIVDGVQESLIGSDYSCTPVTDGANYANRVWALDSGNVSGDNYGTCAAVTDTDDTAASGAIVFDDAVVASVWGGNSTLHFFDEGNSYGDCVDEVAGTESCASVDWAVVADTDRGDVLEVRYAADALHAGLVLTKLVDSSIDLSAFATGTLSFDIKVSAMGGTTGFQLKVESGGANSGEIAVSDITGSGAWETINFPMATLIAGGLDVTAVNVPMVFFPDYQTGANLVYQLDNVRFVAGGDTGTVVTVGAPLSFELAASAYSITDFGGGVGSVVANPDTTGNTSGAVLKYVKNSGEVYGGLTLTLDAAVDLSVSQVVTAKVWSSSAKDLLLKFDGTNVEKTVTTAGGSAWETLTFDFTGTTFAAGADTKITLIAQNGTAGDGSAEWTFYIDDIAVTGVVAEGELIINGDFEDADFTGWTVYDGGSKTVVNEEAESGSFSAKLSATNTDPNAVIKAANMAVGEIAVGQSVTISFDLKGELTGAGGVVFVQFFHEGSTEGSTNGEGILSGGPLVPTSAWVSKTYTQTINTNVDGGVSLQLKAGCGADVCTVDAYFDNVSVVVN